MNHIQTIQFRGIPAEKLYNAYLSSVEHGKMTTSGEGEDKTLATNKDLVTDLPSTLVLRFKATAFGSEIQMAHINVPDYEVFIEQTGEKDTLGKIINTHWGLQYWEPMQKYFGCNL